MVPERNYPPAALSWLVWGLGAALYFTGFYQRVAPAVMTDGLMAEFRIGATALGNFSAFYFYSYVAMQIPTGILADCWGPRKLLTTGALVAGIGTLVFSLAPVIYVANLGRMLIGGSVAVAWVVLLKLSTRWFPLHRYALVSGIALFVGVVGAVTAGVPLRLLIDRFSWRPVMAASAALTLLLAIAIWMVVRDDPEQKGYRSYAPSGGGAFCAAPGAMVAGLGNVFRYRNTWLLTLAPGGVVGPVLAFSGLWGVPFLTTHYGLSPARSAAVTSLLMVSWAVGGPVLGALSDRIGRRKPLYVSSAIVAVSFWAVVLFFPGLPIWLLVCLIAIIGFASGSIIIGFAFVKESVPPELAGTVSGVCNMGVMSGPMVLQPAMGWMLDRHWSGAVENGVRLYDLGAYRSAFMLMAGWALLTVILVAFSRETYCRQTVSPRA